MRTRTLVAIALSVAVTSAGIAASPPAAEAQGDWDVRRDPFDREVVARYKRLLRRDPHDGAARRKLARMYRRHRSIEKLVGEYERELERHPERVSAAIVLGHLHRDRGAADRALASYQSAVAIRPASPRVHVAIAEIHEDAGRVSQARAAYRDALTHARRRAGKAAILEHLADLAAGAGDTGAARDRFEAYLEIRPGDIDARLRLGDALAKGGEHRAAIEHFREAEARLGTDPQRRVEVIARIGQAYESAGEEDAAVREYRRAMSRTRKGYYLRAQLTERIIDIYRRRQALADLLDHYQSKWPVRRRDHFEWSVLARLYEETGDQDRSIEAYRKAVAAAPHELDTQRRLIELLENAGRDDEAIEQYERVIRVAPGEARFRLELAQKYWEAGAHDRALRTLERIERRFSGDPGVASALADLYTRWGKRKRALATYKRLARIEPDEIAHLVNLGEQYFQRGDKNRAVAVWRRIVRRETPERYARLGEVFSEHDMLGDAIEMYDKAIGLAPERHELYRGRAAVHERRRKWDEAIADWNKLLELTADDDGAKPLRREARRRVVNLLVRAGGRRLSKRVRAWERAFRAEPPDMRAGYFLVEAHLREDQSRKARDVLERILSLRPDDVGAMHQLVDVYRAQHEYDAAVKLLLDLVERSPGREREYYNEIAEIKTILNEDEEAIQYAQKALDSSPKDPVAHQRLAERYEAMQDYDEAIGAYERAIELDRRNFPAHFALARLYRNKGELSAEAKLYREILKRASDEEILIKAGREAINLEELTGTLGALEKVLAPLAFTFSHKPVYRRILVELYGRYVPQLVRDLRRGDAGARDAARAELERLGSHGLRPLLQALADEDDVAQRQIAVSVLGYLGNKGAAPPLVKLATESRDRRRQTRRARLGALIPSLDWDMRVEALVAAGRLGDPRTIPTLVELTRHREVAMREAATFALGMTGDDRAVNPLLRALGDQRESVQTLSCLGLARVGVAGTVGRIAAVVRDGERSENTRAACAFALGAIGDEEAIPTLSETLGQGNDDVQRAAAWALGRIGSERALPALLGAYFDKRPRVRQAVAWALPQVAGADADERPAAVLLDYPMRSGKFDEDRAVRQLLPPLDPPPLSPSVIVGHSGDLAAGIRRALGRHRDIAARVLVDLDQREGGLSLGPLTARLGDAPAASRRRVERALDTIAGAVAGDVAALAEHPDAEVRRRAVSVLSKTAWPEADAVISRALADPADSVASAAIAAAARRAGRGAPRLVRELAGVLESGTWRRRVVAARALGTLGRRSDPEALSRAARGDEVGFVRDAAVRALGHLGARSGVPALLAATRDPVARVRLSAVGALSRIGDDRARARLVELARSDSDPAVRRAAARAARGLAPTAD